NRTEEAELRRELRLGILRHVAGLCVFDPFDLACRGGEISGKATHQRRLPYTVRADDRDALSRLDIETNVLEHLDIRTRIPKAHSFERDDRTIQLLRLLESDVGVLSRRRLDVFDLDLLDLLQERRCLARLRGVRREPPHELLQIGDALLRL